MAAKKEIYIEYELEFLEGKLIELKEYILARPFNELTDRIHWKETKSGGAIPMVTASIEAQRKDLTQALKDYAEITQTVQRMREQEEKKVELRGKSELSPLAEKFLNKKDKDA